MKSLHYPLSAGKPAKVTKKGEKKKVAYFASPLPINCALTFSAEAKDMKRIDERHELQMGNTG